VKGGKMNKKIFILTLVTIFLMGLISASDNLGCVKQGDNFRIAQTCDDASYITIDSISYVGISTNSTPIIKNVPMTLSTGYEYYYMFNLTSQLGRYDVRESSDGCTKSVVNYFTVTPNGLCQPDASSTPYLVFVIFAIVLFYGITFIGMFIIKNEWVTIAGGMAMIFLGVYLANNGIIIQQDDLTTYISVLTWGLGAIASGVAGYELIVDNF
jgi:hypothetical protein